MDARDGRTFLGPISRRLNDLGSGHLRRSAQAILRADSSHIPGRPVDSIDDDDSLAPVMPAIDAVQQLAEEEYQKKLASERISRHRKVDDQVDPYTRGSLVQEASTTPNGQSTSQSASKISKSSVKPSSRETSKTEGVETRLQTKSRDVDYRAPSLPDISEDLDSFVVHSSPVVHSKKQEDYEFIPKSVILDVYSNDPEVKRFLKQLPKIANEFGYNEQDYKCYSCRRPIGMVFGQSNLCHFDGHLYCSECHLGDKVLIPARILCNWDFNKYPISKRNHHFLTLISNEPTFEIKTLAPLLFKVCPELHEVSELRCQAFFIRSYCFTCVQESVSFELTKLIWPREHLIKQTDMYSLEDLINVKNGTLKQVLKNVITFGRQHVLSCMLCCQKGFICEICKSSQIIYPFDTDSVYRCVNCQSIYHKTCFKFMKSSDECPRCKRLNARRKDE